MSEEFYELIEKKQLEDEVVELVFDGIAIKELTPKMKQKLENFPTLTCLSLNNCQLENLNNLPNISDLNRIELMGNKFDPKEIAKLQSYQKLDCVSIGDNQINVVGDVAPLAEIESIVQLDFCETKFSESEDYREKVFELFPNLKILDNKDINGNSYEFEDDEEFEASYDGEISDDVEEDSDDNSEEIEDEDS